MPEAKSTILRSPCNLAMALEPEARPVINHFRLKRVASETAWPVYCNDNLSLAVTGMGKTSAAAACAWLQAHHPAPVWLNIGIAGHETGAIGSRWLVNRVRDNATAECWFPQTMLLPGLKTRPLLTVDRPAEYESADDLYDMEASGFISTCIRFTTLEWIQLIKIVSDNRDSHWQELDKKKVPELIASALTKIESVIHNLTEQYPIYHPLAFDADLYETIIYQHHFTVTQKNELKQLLTRCNTLECTPDTQQFLHQENAHSILALITDSIARTAKHSFTGHD